MKIASWNMLYSNRDLERAYAFIQKADFDVLCLQEVPEPFLERLRELPYHLAETMDVERLFLNGNGHEKDHLVILSRYPIIRQDSFKFPEYWDKLPFRTRVFVFLMRPLGWSEIRNRNGLYADINVNGRAVRIFNIHLILAHPAWRMQEFERAMAERDHELPTAICGDFNILESPRVSIINWLSGGKITDSLLWTRERTTIEERFISHKLSNPLRGTRTHRLSRSQLDHILLSRHFKHTKARVESDPLGSDHHPISVETSL